MKSPSLQRGRPAILALNFLCFAALLRSALNAPAAKVDVMVIPDIVIQTEDYAEGRRTFHTDLLQKGLHFIKRTASIPNRVGVTEVYFPVDELHLRGLVKSSLLGEQEGISGTAVSAWRILVSRHLIGSKQEHFGTLVSW